MRHPDVKYDWNSKKMQDTIVQTYKDTHDLDLARWASSITHRTKPSKTMLCEGKPPGTLGSPIEQDDIEPYDEEKERSKTLVVDGAFTALTVKNMVTEADAAALHLSQNEKKYNHVNMAECEWADNTDEEEESTSEDDEDEEYGEEDYDYDPYHDAAGYDGGWNDEYDDSWGYDYPQAQEDDWDDDGWKEHHR